MTNYTDIIEDDDVNELLTLRDQTTEASFRAGDITLKYINKRQIYGVTKAYIYSATGSFFGRQARTMRDYSNVAEFYPKEVREQYPILSFQHFRVAMRSDDWEEVLEYAIEKDQRPATVDDCIAKFNIKNSVDQDSLEDVLQPLRRYIVRLPHGIRSMVEAMLEDIEKFIQDAIKETT
jgi:hypothetical protein